VPRHNGQFPALEIELAVLAAVAVGEIEHVPRGTLLVVGLLVVRRVVFRVWVQARDSARLLPVASALVALAVAIAASLSMLPPAYLPGGRA
jgi:hypothetical protein